MKSLFDTVCDPSYDCLYFDKHTHMQNKKNTMQNFVRIRYNKNTKLHTSFDIDVRLHDFVERKNTTRSTLHPSFVSITYVTHVIRVWYQKNVNARLEKCLYHYVRIQYVCNKKFCNNL